MTDQHITEGETHFYGDGCDPPHEERRPLAEFFERAARMQKAVNDAGMGDPRDATITSLQAELESVKARNVALEEVAVKARQYARFEHRAQFVRSFNALHDALAALPS